MGIFSSGGGSPLVSATVNNSSTVVASANSGGRWLFTDLGSNFNLSAGTYTLGYFNPAGGTDPFRGGATGNYMAGASFAGGKARNGAPSFAWPDASSPSGGGWYGPNLRTGAAVQSTPEPGAVAMLAGVGVTVSGLFARRRIFRRI